MKSSPPINFMLPAAIPIDSFSKPSKVKGVRNGVIKSAARSNIKRQGYNDFTEVNFG